MEVRTPEQYAGEPRCFICGMSPGSVYFPMCCDTKPDGTRYTHDETCSTYPGLRNRRYDPEWLCTRCEAAEAAWLAEEVVGQKRDEFTRRTE
jgi:hypothetical protein